MCRNSGLQGDVSEPVATLHLDQSTFSEARRHCGNTVPITVKSRLNDGSEEICATPFLTTTMGRDWPVGRQALLMPLDFGDLRYILGVDGRF